MADGSSFDHAARVEAAASNIRVDAATAEVLRAFERAGVASVLLKGPALSAWYSAEQPRSYLDCDLWVPPRDLDAAKQTLAELGFDARQDEEGMPGWWQEHASSWERPLDGVVVDLHRTLQGIRAEPVEAWDVLTATTDAISVAGYRSRVLSPPARALYVALHAAHHGEVWGKAIAHLDAALSAADDAIWRRAAALAVRLEAVDSFAAGLRLTPAGTAVAERLGLPANRSVQVALHASTPPPVALGFQQLASAHGWMARVRIIARKLVPPPGFIRHWWPPAARNTALLAIGYLYRPVWLLRNAPRGWEAWRRARRRVRAGR